MRPRSRAFLQILMIAASMGMLISPIAGATAEPIVVGILQSEKFPYAVMMKNSFDMALEAVNREGGINGRPLTLVFADDQGDRRAGERAVRELVKKAGAVMLVGGYSSTNTVYTAIIANKLNVPFLVTTAADDRITQRELANVFRMNPPAKEYGKGVEGLLLQTIKPRSMAIVYENSPYGTGGGLQMMWFCREHDIEIRKIIPYHRERASEDYFRKLLSSVREEPPDVIYMVSYLRDAVLLVGTIRELNLPSLLIGGAGGFTHHKFITMAGGSADRLLTATLWTHQLPYPGTREYHEEYVERYAAPPDYHGAEAYSALLLAADVLRRAESLRPESIRSTLAETDMKTPFGPIRFASYGKFERQNSLPTMVLQVVDGVFEVVWPGDIATSAFLPPSYWRVSER